MDGAVGVAAAGGDSQLLEFTRDMRIVGRSDSRTVGLVVLLAVLSCRGSRPAGRPAIIPGDHGDRVIVEVLNARGTAGPGRTATAVQRAAGAGGSDWCHAPA